MSKKDKKKKDAGVNDEFNGENYYGYTGGGAKSQQCHTGNFKLFGVKKVGLEIGGLMRGVKWYGGDVVIDLTGKESHQSAAAENNTGLFTNFLKGYSGAGVYEWLSLPFQDYGIPALKQEDWVALTSSVLTALEGGHNVVVFCQGGHGRTGMFASIVGYLLNQGKGEWANPVKHLRKIYCIEAVDTIAQEKYVYEMLGLPFPKDTGRKPEPPPAPKPVTNADVVKGSSVWQPGMIWDSMAGGWVGMGSFNKPAITHTSPSKPTNDHPKVKPVLCPICRVVSSVWVVQFGMCVNCQQKSEKEITRIAQEEQVLSTEVTLMNAEGNCPCGDEQCVGIYKCIGCGHVVHGEEFCAEDLKCKACHDRKAKHEAQVN